MPLAFIAVISLSPESRCIASSVPSSSAIGMTRTTSPGSVHTNTSTAAQSGAPSWLTSRPTFKIELAARMSV